MNMLEEYINFEKNNINIFAKEVLSEIYDEEMFTPLLNAYIDTRYYNTYSEDNSEIEENIFKHLNKALTKMMDNVDNETKDKMTEMYVLFNYILCFDNVNEMDDKILVKILCDHRKDLFGTTDNLFQENITKLITNTKKKRKKFLSLFNTDGFYLEKYTTSKENLIDIELNHKLKFPKIYSDYAIDRVFKTEDIGEDRLLVEYYLISETIINDIKACSTNTNYLIEFSSSLFDDKEKLQKVQKIAESDCFKNQAVFKVTLEEYVKHGNNIKDMIRNGYRFAIYIGREKIDDDFILFSIFEYIIVSKNSKYCKEAKDNDKIVIINDR